MTRCIADSHNRPQTYIATRRKAGKLGISFDHKERPEQALRSKNALCCTLLLFSSSLWPALVPPATRGTRSGKGVPAKRHPADMRVVPIHTVRHAPADRSALVPPTESSTQSSTRGAQKRLPDAKHLVPNITLPTRPSTDARWPSDAPMGIRPPVSRLSTPRTHRKASPQHPFRKRAPRRIRLMPTRGARHLPALFIKGAFASRVHIGSTSFHESSGTRLRRMREPTARFASRYAGCPVNPACSETRDIP